MFVSDEQNNQKMFISARKARKWLANSCTGFLASIVDTTKKEKDELYFVLVLSEFAHVFLEDLSSLPPK